MPRRVAKRTNIFRTVFVLACAALALASTCLCGCLGLISQEEVAATVNDIVIDEADVTSYVEGFRSENETLETNAGWAQHLSSNGYTSESLRTYVLETVFIPAAVIRIKAEENGIVVTDEVLDEVIKEEKAYYEDAYGADTWESVLASYGYDEESWRESETERILRDRLKAEVIEDVEPTNGEIEIAMPDIAPLYNGKHSFYILFDDEEAAFEEVDLLGGEDSHVSLKQFKRDGAVNAGWSSLSSSPMALNSAYNNALNNLEEGTISGAVDLGDGTWAVIYCDKGYVFEEGDIYNTQNIPAPIYKQIVSDISDNIEESAFETWLDSATNSCTVVINNMPAGLPYDTSTNY